MNSINNLVYNLNKIFPFFPNLIMTEYENKQWNSAWNIKSLNSAFLLTIKQRIKRGTVRIESIINFSHLFMWKMATSKTCNVQSNSEFLSYAISKIGLTGTTAIHQAHGDAQCGCSIRNRISKCNVLITKIYEFRNYESTNFTKTFLVF